MHGPQHSHPQASQERPTSVTRLVVPVGAGFATLLLIGLLLLNGGEAPSPTEAKMVLIWSEQEQLEVALFVDGDSIVVPDEPQLTFTLDAAEHDIRITRPGFDVVRQRIALASGESRVFQPLWRPISVDAAIAFFWTGEQAEVALTVDDVAVPVPDDAGMVYRVDPGQHTVRLSRPGFTTLTTTVAVGAGDEYEICPEWTASDAPAGALASNMAGESLGSPSGASRSEHNGGAAGFSIGKNPSSPPASMSPDAGGPAVAQIKKESETVEETARDKSPQTDALERDTPSRKTSIQTSSSAVRKPKTAEQIRREKVAKYTSETRQRMVNRVKENSDRFQNTQRSLQSKLSNGGL